MIVYFVLGLCANTINARYVLVVVVSRSRSNRLSGSTTAVLILAGFEYQANSLYYLSGVFENRSLYVNIIEYLGSVWNKMSRANWTWQMTSTRRISTSFV